MTNYQSTAPVSKDLHRRKHVQTKYRTGCIDSARPFRSRLVHGTGRFAANSRRLGRAAKRRRLALSPRSGSSSGFLVKVPKSKRIKARMPTVAGKGQHGARSSNTVSCLPGMPRFWIRRSSSGGVSTWSKGASVKKRNRYSDKASCSVPGAAKVARPGSNNTGPSRTPFPLVSGKSGFGTLIWPALPTRSTRPALGTGNG